MAQLSGIVVVTGAASGLGREAARHFADCGAAVLAVDINRAGLDEIASPRIEPFVADVSRAADCAADGTWEFLFTAPPLKVTGGVGSPLNPLAVK